MSLRDDLAARLSRRFLGPETEPLDPLAAGVGRALVNRRGSKVRANDDAQDDTSVPALNGQQLLDAAANALTGDGANVTVNSSASAAELLRWHIANQQQQP